MSTPFELKVDGQTIDLNSIIWLEGDWNYTRIYQEGRPVFLSSYTLKRYERALIQFIRVRKNVIVNPAHVIAFQNISLRSPCLQLTLSSGERIVVARRRQVKIRRYLQNIII